jgi:hypothetical protein
LYVDQFSASVDQLAAYESEANPLYYVMCFIDGLREDIKAMVMIQCPAMLDATCALALVQEEAADSGKKDLRRFESSGSKANVKYASPLPLLPKVDKLVSMPSTEDTHNTKAVRAASSDDKLHALKQYWRAHGLCERCVEK